MRRGWLWLGLGLGVAALGWGAWRAIDGWRSRSALELAKREMARGHYRTAGARLARLSARWARWDEVDDLLGVCEASVGRPDGALAAWARVTAGSPFSIQAIVRRAQVEMGRGRFAAAEGVLLEAFRDPRRDVPGARHVLAERLWQQGRYDEVIPLFEANREIVSRPDWPHPADAIELLRAHITMDLFSMPIERIRAAQAREALAGGPTGGDGGEAALGAAAVLLDVPGDEGVDGGAVVLVEVAHHDQVLGERAGLVEGPGLEAATSFAWSIRPI